jgi:NitT/TauT family transport system ATP-binding protein
MANIVLDNVSRTFTRDGKEFLALDKVSYVCNDGEFVAVVGPSGCGKTTCMRMAAGLEFPSSGTVKVGGKTVTKPGPDRAVVFQAFALFPWKTVQENIQFGLRSLGVGREEAADRIAKNLKLMNLEGYDTAYPHQLSGGMQQRVAIARALAAHPPLLLMDEPFGALDEMTREHMQAELLRICGETSTTVVFVTHSIPEAVYLSTRVVVMSPRPGRITDVIDVDLGTHRDVETREADAFFKKVTEVREALRGIDTTGIEPDIEQALEEPVEG